MKFSAILVLAVALQCAYALPLAPLPYPPYPFPVEGAYPPFGYPPFPYPYPGLDFAYPSPYPFPGPVGTPVIVDDHHPVLVEPACAHPVVVEPACGCSHPVVVEQPHAVIYEAPRPHVIVEELVPCNSPDTTVLEEKSNHSPSAVASAQNYVNVGPHAVPHAPCAPCVDPVVVVDPNPCDNVVVPQYPSYFPNFPYFPPRLY